MKEAQLGQMAWLVLVVRGGTGGTWWNNAVHTTDWCVCGHVCVGECACVCVRVPVYVRMYVRVCACARVSTRRAQAAQVCLSRQRRQQCTGVRNTCDTAHNYRPTVGRQ